jgi:hypothetical protein
MKSFNIDSILERKITDVQSLDVIDELKQKKIEACQTVDERRPKE